MGFSPNSKPAPLFEFPATKDKTQILEHKKKIQKGFTTWVLTFFYSISNIYQIYKQKKALKTQTLTWVIYPHQNQQSFKSKKSNKRKGKQKQAVLYLSVERVFKRGDNNRCGICFLVLLRCFTHWS